MHIAPAAPHGNRVKAAAHIEAPRHEHRVNRQHQDRPKHQEADEVEEHLPEAAQAAQAYAGRSGRACVHRTGGHRNSRRYRVAVVYRSCGDSSSDVGANLLTSAPLKSASSPIIVRHEETTMVLASKPNAARNCNFNLYRTWGVSSRLRRFAVRKGSAFPHG